jgi:hypothetical protein
LKNVHNTATDPPKKNFALKNIVEHLKESKQEDIPRTKETKEEEDTPQKKERKTAQKKRGNKWKEKQNKISKLVYIFDSN